MDVPQFIHSLADGIWCLFLCLAIIKTNLLWTLAYLLVWTYNLSWINNSAGFILSVFIMLKDTVKLLSKVAISFYISSINVCFSCSTSLPILGVISLFACLFVSAFLVFIQEYLCAVLIFILQMTSDVEHRFLFIIHISSLRNFLLRYFYPFLSCTFCVLLVKI